MELISSYFYMVGVSLVSITALLAVLYVIWDNYHTIQTIKKYHAKKQSINSNTVMRHGFCSPLTGLCDIYPWWHSGFFSGVHRAPPARWGYKYYHPVLGWYVM